MVAKPGSSNVYRNKFLIGIGAVLLLALVIFLVTREDSRYHKVTRLERFTKRLSYMAGNTPASAWMYGDIDSFSLSMPFYRQERALSCEVAALRTVLNYFGHNIGEEELLSKLAFDTRDPMTPSGIWGDPEKGFVGDVDGSVFYRTGFGVYEGPILDLARKYRDADVIEDATLDKLLGEVLEGNPVIAWGLLSRRKPISWKTFDGSTVEVEPGEHARVVIGFTGGIDNPTKIILLDPIYGLIHMGRAQFLSDWAIMDNRAVVVYK